jgi:hypothetical protein
MDQLKYQRLNRIVRWEVRLLGVSYLLLVFLVETHYLVSGNTARRNKNAVKM